MSSAQALKEYFDTVAEKMADLPVFNPLLSVSAVGFKPCLNGELGILITPWCMNLILLPAADSCSDRQDIAVGHKEILALPSGRYEFIWGEAEGVGSYMSCSLFSPVFEFDSQDAALNTANEVMEALFESENYAPTDRQAAISEQKEQASQSRQDDSKQDEKVEAEGLTRRGFLTGGLKRKKVESYSHESL